MDAVQPTHRKKTADPVSKIARKPSPRRLRKPAYLQRKLALSHPQDAEEREADQVAREVASTPRAADTGPRETEEMISSAAVASARRLRRRSSTPGPARQSDGEEEELQMRGLARQIEGEEEAVTTARRLRRQSDGEEEELQMRRVARQAEDEEVVTTARPLQRQNDGEEEELQMRLARVVRRRSVQRDEDATEGPDAAADATVDEQLEARIESRRGAGNPLSDTVREDMETRFGQDFSRVGIHTDAEAAELCRELHARAFAVGNDVFFAPGEFAPQTEAGRELLAHELTHVVQQGSGRRPKLARADDAGPGGPVRGDCRRVGAPHISYEVDPTRNAIRYNRIEVPPYKVPFMTGRALRRARGQRRVDSMQNDHYNDIWRQGVGPASVAAVAAYINRRLDQHYHGGERPPIYAFRARNGFRRGGERNPQFRHFIGSAEDVARELVFPTWNMNGEFTSFEVDHNWELQLGGPNELPNFWLLNATTNQRTGRSIWNNLRNINAKGFSENEKAKAAADRLPGTGSSDQVLDNYDISIEQPAPDGSYSPQDDPLPPRYFWTRDEITSGQHVDVGNLDTLLEIDDLSELGGDGRVKVFPQQGGGVGRLLTTRPRISPGERDWIKPWQISGKEFFTLEENADVLGHLHVRLPGTRATEAIDEETLTLGRYPGAGFAGHMDVGRDFLRLFGQLQVLGLSPVRVDRVAMGEGGLEMTGKVLPTVPLISDAELDLEVSDGEVRIFKAFAADDFQFPRPFSLDSASLSVGAGSARGLYVEGRLDFSVERLGIGYLEGVASTSNSFALAGGFDFDSELFDRAHIDMWYRNEQFGASGEIGIDSPDKIRGIRSATISASYEAGTFSAEGSVEPDMPGVQQAGLEVAYSEADGLIIGGTLQLAPNPAIRSGSVAVTVSKRDDAWKVAATGTAQPAIPGVASQLSVSYDDGAFTAEFSGAYRRGMLAGQVSVGASNRALDEQGQPTGEAGPDSPIVMYGSGLVTVQIAPWLQGTVGIRFAPDGEVTVSGEIGIPGAVEIFARRQIEKSLFNIAVQVPIVPGIVAEIGGGLSAQAGIGPGMLERLNLGITYNPAQEADTHVFGGAQLRVPADAGLRLSVRAGVGIGITGASVTGGLEIGGTLGVEGAAEAAVEVDWTPAQGLDLRATLSVHAQPSFTFDISGYVSARALGVSVYEERWQLASYSFGSDYRFGISLPVHYREGEPFEIGLDDVRFEVPNVDPGQILRGLIRRIV